MADVCLQQPEVVMTWPWIEISGRNLIRKEFFAFLKAIRHKTRKENTIYDGMAAILKNLKCKKLPFYNNV